MSLGPVNVVLLAAGRGSRLSPLTDEIHKSLLPVGGRPVIGYVLEEVLSRPVEQVVVVTGDKRESIESFVAEWRDDRLQTVHNPRFAEDTNILSTALGVGALREPERGYLIVETDLVIEPRGWATVLDVGDGRNSFWVTRGHYGPELTGGALKADTAGRVQEMVYAPGYDAAYEGWSKLVGLLYVGRDQVFSDREIRNRAVEQTIQQYYMTPWVEHLERLPCQVRSLDGLYAASFNDVETYRRTERERAAALIGTLG